MEQILFCCFLAQQRLEIFVVVVHFDHHYVCHHLNVLNDYVNLCKLTTYFHFGDDDHSYLTATLLAESS